MIDSIPLLGIFILTSAIVLASVECGYRLGHYLESRNKSEKKPPVGAMVQTTQALVAFILAFTFGASAEHFNSRRLLVIDEANAIGTTFLRTDFLPAQDGEEFKELLRQYVFIRVDLEEKLQATADKQVLVAKAISDSEVLQNRMWKIAIRVGKENLGSDIIALFVDSLNGMIDLQSKRVAAAKYARIPNFIWWNLSIAISLGMIALGYQFGRSGARSWTATATTVVAFSLVIVMIGDLDRSVEGTMRGYLKPMVDLGKQIGPPKSKPGISSETAPPAQ